MYVAHHERAQFVEWKSATVLGGRIGATAPPFITTGIAANAIGCVNTGFNPNNGTFFTLDDCGFMTYYSTNIEEASIDGGNDGTSAIRYQNRIATNSTAGNVNAAIATDTFTGTAITDGSGLTGIGRALSSATQTVWNQGIEAQTSSETSTATPDIEMYVLGRNNNGTIADVSTAKKILAFVALGAWDASDTNRLEVVADIDAAIAAFVA